MVGVGRRPGGVARRCAGPVVAQMPTAQATEFPAGTLARIAIRPDPILVVREAA